MSVHPDPSLLADTESAPELRLEALRHAASCAECSARLAGRDGSRIFALLALSSVPPAALQAVSERVNLALDEREARRRTSAWRPWAAAVAASLALAGALGAYVWLGRGQQEPAAAVAGAQQTFVPPAEVTATATPTAAAVELLEPETADVVSFRVGDVQVVMIFDERLAL